MAVKELTPDEAKRRREQYEQSTMTVEELYAALGEVIAKGDGDAMIDVDDNCGGSYPLPKFNIKYGTAPLVVSSGQMGKWISFVIMS